MKFCAPGSNSGNAGSSTQRSRGLYGGEWQVMWYWQHRRDFIMPMGVGGARKQRRRALANHEIEAAALMLKRLQKCARDAEIWHYESVAGNVKRRWQKHEKYHHTHQRQAHRANDIVAMPHMLVGTRSNSRGDPRHAKYIEAVTSNAIVK